MSPNHEDTPETDYHQPVLAEEVLELLRPVMPGLVIDATFGGGGHARRMLDEFGDEVTVVGIDRDPEAVANARAGGVDVITGNFADVRRLVMDHTQELPSAVLFDFGVSSHQLDEARRGFSYRNDGPLDMRMGPDAPVTASTIVNEYETGELAAIIRKYGEEPLAMRIASAIVRARPLENTSQLATVIAGAIPAARRRAGHPARRTFQALRIAVNGELAAITDGLEGSIDLLDGGGRLLAISYHSLEDRIVKQRFVKGAQGCTCPPELPVCGCGHVAELRLLTRKPITAGEAEVAENHRARSARLRAAEKVAA